MAVLGTQTQAHPRGCDVERALSTELSKPFRGAGQAVLGFEYKADREASTTALQPQLCPAQVCQLILTVSLTRV